MSQDDEVLRWRKGEESSADPNPAGPLRLSRAEVAGAFGAATFNSGTCRLFTLGCCDVHTEDPSECVGDFPTLDESDPGCDTIPT